MQHGRLEARRYHVLNAKEITADFLSGQRLKP